METTPQIPSLIDEFGADTKNIITEVNGIKISDEPSHEYATQYHLTIKKRLKEIDEARKEKTKTAREWVAFMNNQAKMLSEPLEKLEGILERKIIGYRDEQERIKLTEFRKKEEERMANERIAAAVARTAAEEQVAAERAAAEAKGKKAKEAAIAALEVARAAAELASTDEQTAASQIIEVEAAPKQMRTEVGLSSTKKVWTFEIENTELIPDRFWVIDEKALRSAIVNDGEREIAGVKIFQTSQLSSRV